MKVCEKCNLKFFDQEKHCPLCKTQLKEIKEQTSTPNYCQPKETRQKHKIPLKTKLLYIAIMVAVFVLIDFCVVNLIGHIYDWSAVFNWIIFFIGVVICFICLVWHTILSKRGIFEKVMLLSLAIVGCGLIFQTILRDYSLVVNYILPITGLFCAIIMFVLTNIFNNKFSYQITSIFVLSVFLILSIVFLCVNLYYTPILLAFNIAFCSFAIIIQCSLYHKKLRTAFAIMFHI